MTWSRRGVLLAAAMAACLGASCTASSVREPDHGAPSSEGVEPGDRVAFRSGGWHTVAEPLERAQGRAVSVEGFSYGDVVAAATGDVTGNGRDEVVVSFRRPFRPTTLSDLLPDHQWWDAAGRSAHLGVYGPDFDEIWVAGALVQPVVDLAVCDGSLVVAYSELDDPSWTAAGALTWNGFGFDASAEVAVPVDIGCVDANRDGSTEPFVLRR